MEGGREVGGSRLEHKMWRMVMMVFKGLKLRMNKA